MAHRDVRGLVERAIGLVEDLEREPRVVEHERIRSGVESLRGNLARFEGEIDRKGPAMAIAIELDRLGDVLSRAAHRMGPVLRQRSEQLALDAKLFLRDLAPSLEIPSKPLFGVLPIARIVPQDVHSVLDYSNGLMTIGSAAFARRADQRAVALALGAGVIAVSAITDYRLSLVNLLPIEVHEVLDYVWGATAIGTSIALLARGGRRFRRRRASPLAAALQIAAGAGTIIGSLFTDYRAAKGRGHAVIESEAAMGARIQPGLSTHIEAP